MGAVRTAPSPTFGGQHIPTTGPLHSTNAGVWTGRGWDGRARGGAGGTDTLGLACLRVCIPSWLGSAGCPHSPGLLVDETVRKQVICLMFRLFPTVSIMLSKFMFSLQTLGAGLNVQILFTH